MSDSRKLHDAVVAVIGFGVELGGWCYLETNGCDIPDKQCVFVGLRSSFLAVLIRYFEMEAYMMLIVCCLALRYAEMKLPSSFLFAHCPRWVVSCTSERCSVRTIQAQSAEPPLRVRTCTGNRITSPPITILRHYSVPPTRHRPSRWRPTHAPKQQRPPNQSPSSSSALETSAAPQWRKAPSALLLTLATLISIPS